MFVCNNNIIVTGVDLFFVIIEKILKDLLNMTNVEFKWRHYLALITN